MKRQKRRRAAKAQFTCAIHCCGKELSPFVITDYYLWKELDGQRVSWPVYAVHHQATWKQPSHQFSGELWSNSSCYANTKYYFVSLCHDSETAHHLLQQCQTDKTAADFCKGAFVLEILQLNSYCKDRYCQKFIAELTEWLAILSQLSIHYRTWRHF
ncbi:uncharacterized protein BYT42DRAFT_583486 [Radiomyces spectabilis]|uniref:uncharacterized protein n=1 Tax=Radiomyces spectabilis TaxID=64574 RepID=UPI00221ED327|nr:uncharacterized protein BYT42DRAFT_583486 [Radiomyces spectabilis]KAI8370722.1 hypothetical protein BYT42DRAFT_583486 [Radiomyces spectabilis]